MGLDKIIDFILQTLKDFLPFYVVRVYEASVVLRFGKHYKTKYEGIYFKIPFADEPNTIIYVTTTTRTNTQSFKTKDGIGICVEATIKYNIPDPQKYIETIYDADDGIIDISQGAIMQTLSGLDYSECKDVETINDLLLKRVKSKVRKYGIDVEQVTLTSLIDAKTYRHFGWGGP